MAAGMGLNSEYMEKSPTLISIAERKKDVNLFEILRGKTKHTRWQEVLKSLYLFI